MDAIVNLPYSLVATAPSPATSGTSLIVTAGQGVRFPVAPFDLLVWPAGAVPTPANAEIARCTLVSTDTLTIVRAQYGTVARSIQVGDQCCQPVDVHLIQQIIASSMSAFLLGVR
jgi:hypothetical protein